MSNLPVGMLLGLALVLSGCAKKEEGPPPRTASTPPPAAPPKRKATPAPAPARPDPGPPPVTGIPACDDYIAAYECVVSKLPPAAQAAAHSALQRMKQAWIKAASNPQAQAGLAKACQAGFSAWHKAMGANQVYADCF